VPLQNNTVFASERQPNAGSHASHARPNDDGFEVLALK
jgi:hypothetical protein